MKGLVLSRYPHPDPQIVGWDHKKTNYPGAARKAFLGCFTTSFRKIRFESKWNTTFWVVPEKNFREQRNILKGSPVLPDGMFQAEICVPFLQSHL